jgi:Glycosyl transferases group 1
MRILVIANHFLVCSARYLTDALVRQGHEVRHIGGKQESRIWGLELPERYTWFPDQYDNLGVSWVPDLVVVSDSDPDMLNVPKELPVNAPVVVFGVDSHVRDYRKDYISHYFLSHYNVSIMQWDDSIMTYTPCAYDPTLHTPSPIPFEAREYDVAMIGVMYPQRAQLVESLRKAGLSVLAGTGLVYDQYVAAYHNARISLCVSACGDVAQRVFETAAMGCVVMSDNCADFPLLQPSGVWIYDPTTLVDEAKAILAQPRAALVNIEAAQAWVRPHTWDARAQLLVETLAEKNLFATF